MNPNEVCKYNRTKKQFVVSKSLIVKVGRGSGSANVD